MLSWLASARRQFSAVVWWWELSRTVLVAKEKKNGYDSVRM